MIRISITTNYYFSFKLGLLKITVKPLKTKTTTSGNERLTNLLLLLNYTGYTIAKCNHISNATIHVTPTLKGYEDQMLITRIGV